MRGIVDAILDINHDITRRFQADDLLFDALFLAGYVYLLIRRKRYTPLPAGLISSGVMYLIDGVIWYGTGIRTYGLPASWLKHPVDVMMDVSYGIVAFGWVLIALEAQSAANVAAWTGILFAGWLLTPMLSRWTRSGKRR